MAKKFTAVITPTVKVIEVSKIDEEASTMGGTLPLKSIVARSLQQFEQMPEKATRRLVWTIRNIEIRAQRENYNVKDHSTTNNSYSW